jgi:hypothetical protein
MDGKTRGAVTGLDVSTRRLQMLVAIEGSPP